MEKYQATYGKNRKFKITADDIIDAAIQAKVKCVFENGVRVWCVKLELIGG